MFKSCVRVCVCVCVCDVGVMSLCRVGGQPGRKKLKKKVAMTSPGQQEGGGHLQMTFKTTVQAAVETSRTDRNHREGAAARSRGIYHEYEKMVSEYKAKQQMQAQASARWLSTGASGLPSSAADFVEVLSQDPRQSRSRRGSWGQQNALVERPVSPAGHDSTVSLRRTSWDADQHTQLLKGKVLALQDTISKSSQRAAGFDVQMRIVILSQACEFLSVSALIVWC